MQPTPTPWYTTVAIPGLLRHARTIYGARMRAALEAIGCDDIPGNGLYVIGALANATDSTQFATIVDQLGISKQSAGQLIDALVLRGYLNRQTDKADRRRLLVTLTERGRLAAETQSLARQAVDDALQADIGPDGVAELRRGLGSLCEMGRAHAQPPD